MISISFSGEVRIKVKFVQKSIDDSAADFE